MMLAAAGCRLLMDRGTEGIRNYFSLSCVNSWEGSCLSSLISVTQDAANGGGNAVEVGVETVLLEGKLIGVYSLEMSIKLYGS